MDDHPLKKCPECAEDVRDEARKCRYCGHRFDTPASQINPNTVPTGPTTNGGSATPTHRRWWLMGVIAVALIAATVGVALAASSSSGGSSHSTVLAKRASDATISGCVALWNSAANSTMRGAMPPTGPFPVQSAPLNTGIVVSDNAGGGVPFTPTGGYQSRVERVPGAPDPCAVTFTFPTGFSDTPVAIGFTESSNRHSYDPMPLITGGIGTRGQQATLNSDGTLTLGGSGTSQGGSTAGSTPTTSSTAGNQRCVDLWNGSNNSHNLHILAQYVSIRRPSVSVGFAASNADLCLVTIAVPALGSALPAVRFLEAPGHSMPFEPLAVPVASLTPGEKHWNATSRADGTLSLEP